MNTLPEEMAQDAIDTETGVKLPRRKRRGLSIVELGLYLIIVALLISAVIVAFYQLQTNSQQTQTTNLVNETYSAVQDLHRSATSYGNSDLIPALEAAEMIPPIGRVDSDGTPRSGDETIVTAFDNNVAVEGTGQTFTITLEDYTAPNCVDFMSNYVDRTLEQSGLVSASSAGADFTIPATVASITEECQDGDLALEFR